MQRRHLEANEVKCHLMLDNNNLFDVILVRDKINLHFVIDIHTPNSVPCFHFTTIANYLPPDKKHTLHDVDNFNIAWL